jgi:uncharacterized protein YggE
MSTRPVTLNVRGSATTQVPPDFARLALRVSAEDPDRDLAVARVEQVLTTLRSAMADISGLRSTVISRMHTEQRYHWDDDSQTHQPGGWTSAVEGRADAECDHASKVVAAAVGAGAAVVGVSWLLDTHNPVFRQVRKDAVAAARRAAEDFAEALDRPLGPIVALADPGLLNAAGATSPPRGFALMRTAAPGEPAIELDPEPQEVSAEVEATYEL